MPIERVGGDKPVIRRSVGTSAHLTPVAGTLSVPATTDAATAALIPGPNLTSAALTAAYATKASPYTTGTARVNKFKAGFYDQPTNENRVTFGTGYVIPASATGDNDFVPHLFQSVFTETGWATAGAGTAPDPGYGFGCNIFSVTGTASGDGDGGIFISNATEFCLRSNATIKKGVGLVGETAGLSATGTGHAYLMRSVQANGPWNKGGGAITADHAIGMFVSGVHAGPQTVLLGTQSVAESTIEVVSTRDFASSGTIKIGNPAEGIPVQTITYTGKTASPATFTGCTGGSGSVGDGVPVGAGTGDLGSFHTWSLYVNQGHSYFGGAVEMKGEFGQDAAIPVLRLRAVAGHSGDVFAVLTGSTDAKIAHVDAAGVWATLNSMVAWEGQTQQTVIGLAGPSNEAGVKLGSSGDVNLYRSAANVLKTDDKLITVVGLGVGNSAAATTPGSVVRKMEVFDAAGASLGFVPIYSAIT